MITANEKIFDSYVRHQTYLIRYAGGLRNEVGELLAATNSDLIKTILAYAAQIEGKPITNPEVRKLVQEFHKAMLAERAVAWDQIDDLVTERFKELAVMEASTAATVIGGAVPAAIGFTMPSVQHLHAIALARPFEGRTLKEWLKHNRAVDAERLTRVAKIGIVQGLTPTQMVQTLAGSKEFDFKNGAAKKALRDMESVLLTVTNGVQNEAKAALYEENSDIISQEYFVATLDARTTFVCASNDGEIFKLGEGPRPPLHFRCRSLRVPYINPDNLRNRGFDPTTEKILVKEYAKEHGLEGVSKRAKLPRGHKTAFDAFARQRRRELIGQVPAKTTFNQWLKNQSKDFQDEYLGPTRANIFRQGGITLDKFVAADGSELTISQLKTKLKKEGITVPE